MIDLLYLAHHRPEFTVASLRTLVSSTLLGGVRLVIYTDGDEDLTPLLRGLGGQTPALLDIHKHGGPVAIMNHYLSRTDCSEIFAKIDNDTILPPGWLGSALGVMNDYEELGLLGIEPPASRTPAPWSRVGAVSVPELNSRHAGYAPCEAIGGIGLMRRSAFAATVDRMRPYGPNGVGGFTDWQIRHPEIVKGWIVPPLPVFLLDRLPVEPWISLSQQYIASGVQRPWTNYDPLMAPQLWSWWPGAQT